MYIECDQGAIFVHMSALVLLYIGDELCHLYVQQSEWVVDRRKLLHLMQAWVEIGSREEA